MASFKRVASSATVVFCVLVSRPAHAQFEGVLGSITDVHIFSSCLSTDSESLRRSGSCISQYSFGIEVMWGLTTLRFGQDADSAFAWKRAEKELNFEGGAADSVVRYVPTKVQTKAAQHWGGLQIEMALGYSQLAGFQSTSPDYELRGTVRELPALALYGTLSFAEFPHVKPFAGLRSGLIQLHNFQALLQTAPDTRVAYLGSAQVFQLGGAVGLAIGMEPLHLIAEYAYNVRRFPSIQWTGTGAPLPENLPTELDFTGPSVSLGVQIHVRDPR